MVKLEGWEFFCDRHGVIHQCCRQQLTILAIDNLFPHGLTNALSNTAVYLALHKHRIELASAVVNRNEARKFGFTGIFVNFDRTDMGAKGEDTGFWLKEDGCLQTRLNARS